MHVRSRLQLVSTYTLPLKNPRTGAVGGDNTLVLDPDVLRQQDSAAVVVTCELAFSPRQILSTTSINDSNSVEPFFAVSIPLCSPVRVVLLQLAEQDSATSRNDGQVDRLSGVSSGVPWWSTVAAHAENDGPFRQLWFKVLSARAAQGAGAVETVAPPARFSVTVPSVFRDAALEDEEAQAKVLVEFLERLFPEMDAAVLQEQRRVMKGGRMWISVRTLADNLLTLKLEAKPQLSGALTIAMQCSNPRELSTVCSCRQSV